MWKETLKNLIKRKAKAIIAYTIVISIAKANGEALIFTKYIVILFFTVLIINFKDHISFFKESISWAKNIKRSLNNGKGNKQTH